MCLSLVSIYCCKHAINYLISPHPSLNDLPLSQQHQSHQTPWWWRLYWYEVTVTSTRRMVSDENVYLWTYQHSYGRGSCLPQGSSSLCPGWRPPRSSWPADHHDPPQHKAGHPAHPHLHHHNNIFKCSNTMTQESYDGCYSPTLITQTSIISKAQKGDQFLINIL